MNYYLICINTITFIVFGLDKILAIKNKKRIREKTLITLSFLGGCYLELLGMFIFRHKIRKIKFYIYNIVFILIYSYLLLTQY